MFTLISYILSLVQLQFCVVPQVTSWLINPINTIVITIINHGYCSYSYSSNNIITMVTIVITMVIIVLVIVTGGWFSCCFNQVPTRQRPPARAGSRSAPRCISWRRNPKCQAPNAAALFVLVRGI